MKAYTNWAGLSVHWGRNMAMVSVTNDHGTPSKSDGHWEDGAQLGPISDRQPTAAPHPVS